MNKKIALIGVVVLLIFVGLSGCNEEEVNIKEDITGEWYGIDKVWNEYKGEEQVVDYTFIFYDDEKTFKHNPGFYYMGEYYIVGDRLECYYPGGSATDPFQNYYKIEMPDKDTLILTTIGEGHLTHDGKLEYTRVD